MSFDADTLARLLPAIHLLRDAERAETIEGLLTPDETAECAALEALATPTPAEQRRLEELRARRSRGPMQALLSAFADQFAVLEDNLAQLHDDQFIETCADWVIPYIGDLIGYEPLHQLGRTRALARAEVAHTIALRRRKGTATALEQLARDVTGWKARAVECFELLCATQYLNHLRPHCLQSPDLRRKEPLEQIGGPFDSLRHTVDVRRIESGRGRFNIANVNLWLWRLENQPHTRSPAMAVDARRYLISPLGHALQLFTNPQAEDEITHLAEPVNVPEPISRSRLKAALGELYGTRPSTGAPVDRVDPSLVIHADGMEVPRNRIVVCNLADDQPAWAHLTASGCYGIDPVLGRIALAPDVVPPNRLEVTYHDGFSAAIGGGEYPRERPLDPVGILVRRVPTEYPSIQTALDSLKGHGVVEIVDSSRYEEALTVDVAKGASITLRAAPDCRPTLILSDPLLINGGVGSACCLEGLLLAGKPLRVPAAATNGLARLQLTHLTLVPGLSLTPSGEATSPGAPSLVVETEGVEVSVHSSILGALRVASRSRLSANDSILDANGSGNIAFCAPDDASAGGEISLSACTLIGKVHATAIGLVTNSLLVARSEDKDVQPAVIAEHRQSGCVRFSFLPPDALVPRRHQCQPSAAAGSLQCPRFSSLRYGQAAYGQLCRSTPDTIRRGADDESEMGAFHSLYAPQREANLKVRLQEYLRVGLAAGITYQT